MERQKLMMKLELLRTELQNQVGDDVSKLSSQEIVSLSQEIDQLVVMINKLQEKD
ncbi:hypothetical protein GGQ84_003080 [Desulfitispora alkaliphila]|uniref:Spo0E family sporulation regulatory protein-aspartic acid phosphatase n=1 Tax=Desulfitispora alkaliphila TaxID=622674 RepID=UPI003D21AB54